jgi:hypothetical protein
VFTVSRKAKDAYPTGAAPVPVFGGVQVAHLLVFVPWIMSFRFFCNHGYPLISLWYTDIFN